MKSEEGDTQTAAAAEVPTVDESEGEGGESEGASDSE
jgi:hypothetical protein